IASDLRYPGVIATAVTLWAWSSAAICSASPFVADLTNHASGLPPPPRMSFSVTSTISPRRLRIMCGATCLAVTMCDTSACLNTWSACATSTCQKDPLPHQGFCARDAVDEYVQPAVPLYNTRDQRLDLSLDGVIDAHRHRVSACGGDQGRRFVDGFG